MLGLGLTGLGLGVGRRAWALAARQRQWRERPRWCTIGRLTQGSCSMQGSCDTEA